MQDTVSSIHEHVRLIVCLDARGRSEFQSRTDLVRKGKDDP